MAYAQLAAAMALVGANVAVAKLLAEALPIPLIACLRCALACLVLWPLARAMEGRVRVAPAALRNLALQAVFGTALYNAGLLAGLWYTSALEAGLVLATLPAVVALGSALWLRERLAPRLWAAVALASCGMAGLTLARVGGGAGGSAPGDAAWGNALVFGGLCGEAVYVLLAKRLSGQVPVVTASLWMPLGGDFSTGASVHNGPSGTSETADFSHADNNQVGSLGWLVRVNHDDETSWTASARSKLPMATVRARLAHAGGVTAGSAELAGAVVVADGGVFLTRPINDAFAIVDVGTPAIPVMFQNRALGVTGRDGKLVLPGLNAYEKNRISIDPSKLPLDSVVQTTTAIVVPADRAGVVVKFGDNASGGTALVTFRDAEGAVLPVGTTGKTVPGVPDFMVGYDGQALVQGLAAANALTLTLPDGGLCTADVPYAANGGAMVLIPGAVCRPQ